MARRDIERALEKARLQQQSRELRETWTHYAHGVRPAITAADAAHRGWQWVKQHPVVPVMVVVAVIVARPSLAWRLGQGAWAGWKAWQRWRHLIDLPVDPAVGRASDRGGPRR